MKKLLAAVAFLMATPALALDADVRVEWTDAGFEDGYQIKRENGTCAAPTSTPVTVANVAADVLSFDDVVPDNANYCYHIRATYKGAFGPTFKADVSVPKLLNDITVTAVHVAP